jgi:DNA-binding XRE family transcriptional regulator
VTLIRMVKAPGLLVLAGRSLGMNQFQFGELLGVSRRTMARWHAGQNGPSFRRWVDLVRHVHPVDSALAAQIAAELGETLVSLGVEAPPPPVVPAAQVDLPPPRPMPSVGDLVDSIVCAAAEAIAATPQAVRPALLAAFERAASVGLAVDDVRGALRPAVKVRDATT